MVSGDEVCDDGINDGAYGGCNDDCLTLAAYCGDAELNGPETCDDANDDSADGCLGDCSVPSNCMDILTYDGAAVDGLHIVDIDGDGDVQPFEVTCDMTTDEGGWTRCATIDETGLGADVCVTESLSFVAAQDLLNTSFCGLMYESQTPAGMLIHNRTPDGMSDFGFDDQIMITWGDSPFTLYTYDNHAIADCRNLTTNTVWDSCQYSSHGGDPWQTAAFSFTSGALDNGYSGNMDRRITLGPTFQDGTPGCTWHNFGADSNPENLANTWRAAENIGDMYLR
jgi:cysteine-rich repeat protein